MPAGTQNGAVKYVWDFSEGNKDLKALLGGKGANLAEMTGLGLPVPPGFTITTDACRVYLQSGASPAELAAEIEEHLQDLERRAGRVLGDPADPLLVSVRSGARASMPGMMDTVLNIGLNDQSVLGLAERSGDKRFAFDSYRRLLSMFGSTVLGIDRALFDTILDQAKVSAGVTADTGLGVDDLRGIVADFQKLITEQTGEPFPQQPRRQLELAVEAVFRSWNGDRARLYRRQEHIPDDWGTAVNICTMVFGNLGDDSGSGVCFTRDPATGKSGVYGDYLANAQGEDVVAGIRNTLALADLEKVDKSSYDELLQHMATLERHYRDLCDIEFTIEAGKLWMLQVRVGKRTAGAAFRIACSLVDEGLIDLDEALRRVTGEQLSRLMFPQFDRAARPRRITVGMAASPGAAVGKVVFDSLAAVEWAGRGEDVILVRRETNPDDLHGMLAARGVLTSRGGKTSHAAVVARGMGRTCVCGAEELDVDTHAKVITTEAGVRLVEGDVISIDGATGEVFLGAVPVVPSAVVEALEGQLDRDRLDGEERELVEAVERLLAHADATARMGVRANADTPQDCVRARKFAAAGVGLCRTEHMFLGERRTLVERVILADSDEAREAAIAELLPLLRGDFEEMFAAMDGLPVVVRLLDPPLHEFLPDIIDLSVKVALAQERGEPDTAAEDLLAQVRRSHEQNPMLGLRGVRLGFTVPGLVLMQVRAIAEAAATLIGQGRDPRPEVMVPLVAEVRELAIIRRRAEAEVAEVAEQTGLALDFPIGTMIELPRACLTAAAVAEEAEFFSFGTNDLTQTTWGFSRDDVEAAFFPKYLEEGIFPVSPFESLDVPGVGRLVEIAVREGRQARPDLTLGICGEHGGDPASIHFFESAGLDYVSCSPFRVPIARLEAGRAALRR